MRHISFIIHWLSVLLVSVLFGAACWLLVPKELHSVRSLWQVASLAFPDEVVANAAYVGLRRQDGFGQYQLVLQQLELAEKERRWSVMADDLLVDFSLLAPFGGKPWVAAVRVPRMDVVVDRSLASLPEAAEPNIRLLPMVMAVAGRGGQLPAVMVGELKLSVADASFNWRTTDASIQLMRGEGMQLHGAVKAKLQYEKVASSLSAAVMEPATPSVATAVTPVLVRDVASPVSAATIGEALIQLDVAWPEATPVAEVRANIEQLPAAVIAGLDSRLAVLGSLDVLWQGEALLRLTEHGRLHDARFELKAGKGSFHHLPWFDRSMVIDGIGVTLSTRAGQREWLLDEAYIASNGIRAEARGSFVPDAKQPLYDIRVTGDDFPIRLLGDYWPKPLGVVARTWVLEHITDGVVKHAMARLHMQPEDYVAGKNLAQTLYAKLDLENARVGYYGDLTPVTQATGEVIFTGRGLKARLPEGKIGDATVRHVALDMHDFMSEVTHLNLRAEWDAPLSEVARYLNTKTLAISEKIGLHTNATGTAQGVFTLSLGLGVGGAASYFDYGLEADLHNAANAGLLDRYDVSAAQGAIALNPKVFTYKGQAELNQVPMMLDLSYSMVDQKLTYTAGFEADRAGFARLGIPVPEKMEGVAALKAEAIYHRGVETMQVFADFLRASIKLPRFAYEKAKDTPATIHFEAVTNRVKGVTDLKNIRAKGDFLDVEGYLTLEQPSGMWKEAHFTRAKFGRNDLVLHLARNASVTADAPGIKLVLKGKRLDASGMVEGSDLFTEGVDWPAVEAEADLESIWLGEGRELNKVKGSLSCTTIQCIATDAEGFFASGDPVTYRLFQQQGERRIHIATPNAGEFFRVLDISDNMVGGVMELDAAFDDTKPSRPLKGALSVTNYKTIKASPLAKLLNLASFSGISELLAGGGIAFDKLHAPFVLDGGVIYLSEGSATGQSLGITFNGTLDTTKSDMVIEGTTVPSYMLNSLVGNIPLIGGLLAGGDKGGLFAANYTMKGSFKDPEVFVNPLSMLAPGFLRKLFDIPEAKTHPDAAKPTLDEKKNDL